MNRSICLSVCRSVTPFYKFVKCTFVKLSPHLAVSLQTYWCSNDIFTTEWFIEGIFLAGGFVAFLDLRHDRHEITPIIGWYFCWLVIRLPQKRLRWFLRFLTGRFSAIQWQYTFTAEKNLVHPKNTKIFARQCDLYFMIYYRFYNWVISIIFS